ncbi:Uncharacterized protein OS=Isosphaera pallida (strain ATCC 43644 / DSM 9630 / IS1B) GN=Isop_2424 PE=4 SV=1 [Gemmataceae bacterium]|nr:Uncharacterized protein OS=Isosphaera pallida (strain ATCC 43644 / DSM 9630 / IS1B) GN=Isop_2424 PE=4 SV=1 [Gemmataceae bacterium]VTU02442.1 Uncharacterized protein OS=Isosphaera pallida (strain ATCC 43644 / DSM 9630 / IS1B) GN=Isop_2424 PE=4 SV=1 [Gemmataceae bacterium]
MPNIYERALSRPFALDLASGSITREYVVTGTSLEIEVQELTLLAASVVYLGLVRKAIKAAPQGGGIWFVSVEYANIDIQQAIGEEPQPPEGPGGGVAGGDAPLPASCTWDTTGGTVHIGQSKGTRSVTTFDGLGDATGTQVNNYTLTNKRAIGLADGRVEGVDVFAPAFRFTVEAQRAVCSLAYMNAVRDLTGRVNYGAAFYGFQAGEVLYLGASARPGSTSRWAVTHSFAVQRNEVNLRISDTIVVPVKKGWDYIWVGYRKGLNTIMNQVVNVPAAAFVEYVYDNGDFDVLEIGR